MLLECDPSYYPYVIDVTYKEDASSQSIEVFQIRNDSSPFVTSIYGYGKDYLMESTLLCVNNNLYRFTCSSLYPLFPHLMGRASKPWSEGSFFEVKAFGRTTVMRGTVDIGRIATYYINRCFH